MTATKAESRGIERWSRAQEREMIVAAIEAEAKLFTPSARATAARLIDTIGRLPTLAVVPKAPPGTPRDDRRRLAR